MAAQWAESGTGTFAFGAGTQNGRMNVGNKKRKAILTQGWDWKRIPGYPHHEVSSSGRVRTYLNQGGFGLRKEPRLLALTPLPGKGLPYLRVGLRRNGATKKVYVHHLVALVFIGPRPNGLDVDHVDGDHANNFRENIQYLSRAKNIQKSKCAKLTAVGVQRAREKWSRGGVVLDELAKECGVSRSCMSMALSGKTWLLAGGPIDEVDRRFRHA